MITMTDEQALKAIATNITRRLKGRSYSEIARIVGVYPMDISRIARGKNMPGAGLLTRIAEALDCSADDLLADPRRQKKA